MRTFRKHFDDAWTLQKVAHGCLCLAMLLGFVALAVRFSSTYLVEWVAALFGGLAGVLYGLACFKVVQERWRRKRSLRRIRISYSPAQAGLSTEEYRERLRQLETLAGEVRHRFGD